MEPTNEPTTWTTPEPVAPAVEDASGEVELEPFAEVEPLTPEEPPSTVLQDDPELPYRVTSWNGLPNYECRQCPYAIVDGGLTAILQHIRDAHEEPPPGLMQAAGFTLYDRWGNPLPRVSPEGGD